MTLTLTIENLSTLPDGGPLSISVSGRRGIDIGRDQYLDWTLPDPDRTISGKHAEIRYRDGGYWLRDVSRNGTFLNRSPQRLQEAHRLRDGDRIEIGHYVILARVAGEVADAAAPAAAAVEPRDYWDPPGEAAPPIPSRDLRPPAALRPVRPDFIDWAVDLPGAAPAPVRQPAREAPAWDAAPRAAAEEHGMDWARASPAEPPPPRPAYKVPPRATPTPTASPTATASLPPEQRGDLEAIIRSIRESATAPKPAPTPTKLAQAALPKPKPTPTASPKAKGGPAKEEADDKRDPKAKGAKTAATDKADPKAKAGKTAALDKKKKPVEAKHPARIWVQVAGGANANDLPKEWAAVAGKHADLKAKGPYTAKNRATNRLLTGPFKTEAEAQAAVARLRKAGIGAFQWKSDEGEAVQKIEGK